MDPDDWAGAGARRPFGKLRAGSRDSRQDAGATITSRVVGDERGWRNEVLRDSSQALG
jgi:hypothetical protein